MTATERRFDPEELAVNLFGLEIIVPSQYFDHRIDSGEKRLMLAVLEEAVATFQRHIHDDTGRSGRPFRDVEEWFHSKESLSWPFAFENVCHTLEIDPEYLRRGLEVWARTRARSGKAQSIRLRI